MFAKLRDKISLQWECIIETYLLKVDYANQRVATLAIETQRRIENFSEHPEHARRLLKLTLSGLILTFVVLLLSCQTGPRSLNSLPARGLGSGPNIFGPPNNSRENAGRERSLDGLYLKRQEVLIEKKDVGSATGSIWADSREPRSLLVESTPQREGQTITISIPEELQFNPKSMTSAERNPNNKGTAKSAAKKSALEGRNNNEEAIKLTDPNDVSLSQHIAGQPIKSIKMQIVALEPTGDVFLRGVRKFTGADGSEENIMLLAKVPRRALNGFEIDARELTDVVVQEDFGGQNREYSASGWDDMVSRRLAGFTPDINSELASLESLREEIKTAQSALRDQAKANEMERERIRKERDRMTNQSNKQGATDSPASTKSSETSARRTSSTAQTDAAGKKEGASE